MTSVVWNFSAKVMYYPFEYVSSSVVKSLDEFQYVSPDVQSNIPVQYRVLNKDTGQLSDLRSDDPAELSFRCFNKDTQIFFDIRDGSPWPSSASKEASATRLDLTDLFDAESHIISSETSTVKVEKTAAIATSSNEITFSAAMGKSH